MNNPRGESSGIVDASRWFGPGMWILDVQSHGSNVDELFEDPINVKHEDGQLLLMKDSGVEVAENERLWAVGRGSAADGVWMRWRTI